MHEIERSHKPIVAAIKGQALGGGLELAMACHYRVAVDDKKTIVGLPEVMLGLLPGGGGTQRLPQLCDVQNSLQIMLTGKQVQAKKAKKLGIVDHLVQPIGPGLNHPEERTLEYLEEVAIKVARQLADGSLKPKRQLPLAERILRQAMKIDYVKNYVFGQAEKMVMKLTQGLYPAPFKIIECVKTGIDKGMDEGLRVEARNFAELTATSHSKALIGLFFGQTQCKKNRFGKPAQPIKNVGVIGAGLMGAGIATVSLDKGGHNVLLKDSVLQGLQRGQAQIRKVFDGSVKKKKYTAFERDVKLANLVPTLKYDQFKNCDIVIEAVVEDLKVKHKVLEELEQVIRPDCVFATNTSAISIADIAAASKRPENVIGMHYFSPVEKMPLLEVVTFDKTSKETCSKAVETGLKQGKVVITVKDAPGFYTTRILAFMMADVLSQLLEGYKFHDMDRLSKKMGFPIGLVTLQDEVGIDTGVHITKYLKPIYGDRFTKHDLTAQNDINASGFYGRKTGKGFFIYEKEGKKKAKGPRPVNPAMEELFKKYAVKAPREYNEEERMQRILTRFVNEALICLQEGILANPVEGDIGAVFGLGFPPFHGGPFRYVDTVGAESVLRWMDKFAGDFGSTFAACDLLKDHARDSSKKFHPSK